MGRIGQLDRIVDSGNGFDNAIDIELYGILRFVIVSVTGKKNATKRENQKYNNKKKEKLFFHV